MPFGELVHYKSQAERVPKMESKKKLRAGTEVRALERCRAKKVIKNPSGEVGCLKAQGRTQGSAARRGTTTTRLTAGNSALAITTLPVRMD